MFLTYCFQMCELFCVCCVGCCDKRPQTWWLKNKRFILTVREARYLKSTGLHALWSPRGESVTCLLASSIFWWRPAFLGLWAHHPLPLCIAVSFLCLCNLPLQLFFFGGGHYFLIGGILLCSAVLVSAIQQCESAIIIHICLSLTKTLVMTFRHHLIIQDKVLLFRPLT